MRPPLTPPEFRSWTLSDGYALRGRIWVPSCRARTPVVIYLHGIQSHGGWFEWSASLLAEMGAVVLLPDRRGSGLNDRGRGDTPSAERWLTDIDELAEWAGVEYGADRMLLITPGVFPTLDVGLAARVGIGISLLAGGRHSFDIPLNDPQLFTDNPAGQDFIARDPLRLTRATARFLWHSRRLDAWLARVRPQSLAASITLILAGNDAIICNTPTEQWLRRVAVRPPRVIVVPGSAHTLEFAADPSPLRGTLGDWNLTCA